MTEDIETKAKKLFEHDRRFKEWMDCPPWERLHPSTQKHYRLWALKGKHPDLVTEDA